MSSHIIIYNKKVKNNFHYFIFVLIIICERDLKAIFIFSLPCKCLIFLKVTAYSQLCSLKYQVLNYGTIVEVSEKIVAQRILSNNYMKNRNQISNRCCLVSNSERSDECIDFTMMCVFFFFVSVDNIWGSKNASIFDFSPSLKRKSDLVVFVKIKFLFCYNSITNRCKYLKFSPNYFFLNNDKNFMAGQEILKI
ncbi:Uncharacterized protein FWK35_00023563 [Aphis craccivora]|uniref:Uncharacterized protein n=1 Tax=Aphis craccivora TaxID=307492 RepID=A0A6G0WEK3_APHCR|nr:Uncharacterized protein FWK35_00023563 [Aphis craccivora]